MAFAAKCSLVVLNQSGMSALSFAACGRLLATNTTLGKQLLELVKKIAGKQNAAAGASKEIQLVRSMPELVKSPAGVKF